MAGCAAVVLAAGQGKRMGTTVPKQFLEIQGKPVVYYSLKCFEEMEEITQIVLVTGADSIIYCREEIVEKYGFQKVTDIVAGGKERYDSVYEGLLACEQCDYVYIHDGARPFITQKILKDCLNAVKQYRACVTAVPCKDTIKVAAADHMVERTLDRSVLWNIQTPQVFDYHMIKGAHEEIRKGDMTGVTDDSMIVESLGICGVKLVEGSYDNIKITTLEDMIIAENMLKKRAEQD